MTMEKAGRASYATVIATGCLIGGNLVGAGILGLPINTGLAGLIPAVLAMIAGGAMMYLSAMILGQQAADTKSETFDYPSLYERFLGRFGKWIAVAANLIILYGLLTAYFTGGAKILTNLLGAPEHGTLILLGFAAVLILLTCVGMSLVQKLNTLLMLCLVTAFITLVTLGMQHVQPARMTYCDWRFLPATLPIIVTAFHFHNIIPAVTTDLKWDMPTFRKSVLLGMILAFLMNGLWVMVGIGVLPLSGDNSLLNAWETNLPATVPMEAHIPGKLFFVGSTAFALIAISTSFLANGLGLQNFIRDLFASTFNIRNRLLVILVAFLPPLATAILYPDIFLKALDIVGGVGIVLLFVTLPMLITLIDRRRGKSLRVLCLIVLIAALGILALEFAQESGHLSLKPWVEYHKITFDKTGH